MPSYTYKVLAQAAAPAAIEIDLYRVPLLTQTVVSTLACCNRGGATATFRFSVAVGGAIASDKDYIYYDVAIAGNETFASTIGLTLNANDVIRVYASNANLSFSAFGSEYT